MTKNEALDAIALGIGQLDRFENDFSNRELSQIDNFATQLSKIVKRARSNIRIKKPDCFGSNPSAQAKAENSCYDCSFQNECLSAEPKQTTYIALEIFDDSIIYDGVKIYCGNVKKMGIKEVLQIVEYYKKGVAIDREAMHCTSEGSQTDDVKGVTTPDIAKVAEAIYTAGAKKGWYLDADVTRALAKAAISAIEGS